MNMISIAHTITRTFWFALTALLLGTCGLHAQEYEADEAIPPDDPHGRAAYEYQRLVDPATGRIPDHMRSRELKFAKTLPTRDDQSLFKSSSTAKIATQQWTFRGPRNIGGRSRALGIDVTNPDILLAGGVSGGMWRSMDGGDSWARVTPLDEVQSVSCIAQDTREGKTNTWYYGTGEYIGNSAAGYGAPYLGDGVFKSTDNGATWRQLPSTVEGMPQEFGQWKYVWRMVCDPIRNDSDIVYAAAIGSIFRSNDGGETWNNVLGGGARFSKATDIAISPTGVLYATMSSTAVTASGSSSGTSITKGIFRSEDGMNWTQISSLDNFPFNTTRIVLGIAPSDPNIVYFLGMTPGKGFESPDPLGRTEYHSLFKYTYLSDDGSGTGGKWENRSNSLPYYIYLGPFSSQGAYDLVVKVKPDNPNFVVIAGTNVYRSTNGFENGAYTKWIGGYNPNYDPTGSNLLYWINLAYQNHHPDIHDVVFAPSDANVMYTVDDGGIHKTEDCRTSNIAWKSLNNGFVTSQFYAIAINPDKPGDQTIIGGMQDNSTYGSTGPGKDWYWLSGGDGGYCAFLPNLDNTFIVTSQYGALYKSETDNDLSAIDIKSVRVPNVDRFSFPFIAPIIVDPNDPNIVYIAAWSQVYRNNLINDQFVDYQWVTLDQTSNTSGNITAISVSKNPDSKLFIGTTSGHVYRMDDARTANETPTDIGGGGLSNSGTVSCIAVDPGDANIIMVVYSNYNVRSLFYTSDGGNSWSDVSGNLEENPDGSGDGPSCRWANVVHTGGQTIWFVGTSTGLYSTTALNGLSTVWVQEGAHSIGDAVVTMIRTRQSDGFVAVGTHGNGVFSTNAVPVSVNTVPERPKDFYLEQSYPNPVSATATVRYSVPNNAPFTLKIHDVMGRTVRTLHSGTAAPGVYESKISAGDLPAGTYFIRLESTGFAQTRIMTVTR